MVINVSTFISKYKTSALSNTKFDFNNIYCITDRHGIFVRAVSSYTII